MSNGTIGVVSGEVGHKYTYVDFVNFKYRGVVDSNGDHKFEYHLGSDSVSAEKLLEVVNSVMPGKQNEIGLVWNIGGKADFDEMPWLKDFYGEYPVYLIAKSEIAKGMMDDIFSQIDSNLMKVVSNG